MAKILWVGGFLGFCEFGLVVVVGVLFFFLPHLLNESNWAVSDHTIS